MNIKIEVKDPEILEVIKDLYSSSLSSILNTELDIIVKDELNFNGYISFFSNPDNQNKSLIFLTKYNIYLDGYNLVMESNPHEKKTEAHAFGCICAVRSLGVQHNIKSLAISNCIHPKLIEVCTDWILTTQNETFINMMEIQ